MTNLTKKAKIALTGGGAGLLALAVALGVWQPWRAPAQQQEEVPSVQQNQPLPPAREEEEVLTLTVAGEKIPCTVYEGDVWSIYVPEGWNIDAGENGGVFTAPDGACVEVIRASSADYPGAFVSAYPQYLSADTLWQTRHFYSGTDAGSWEILCAAPEAAWDANNRLLTALARTFTAGEDKPFSALSPVASQPDWQIQQGETLLWMDKDAYIVDEVAEEYVVTEMMSWDKETKSLYTGQYDLAPLEWTASYTCLTDEGYVDVFSTAVGYKVADGMEGSVVLSDGQTLADGWLSAGRMHVVLFHDGSAVNEVCILPSGNGGAAPGGALFAAELMG